MFDYNENPELNITPLVDIMLVLLAILMVAAPTLIYEEKIALPDGSKKETSVNSNKDFIVRVDLERKIHIDQNAFSFAEFPDNAVLLTNQYDISSPVFIKADKELKYDDVMFVLRTLKQAGYTKIALQTNG